MKDYLNNKEKEEKAIYIKSFKVNGDKIKVLFANGDKNIISNTKENRNKIETKMESQVNIGDGKLLDKTIALYALTVLFIASFLTTSATTIDFILKHYLIDLKNVLMVLIPLATTTFVGIKTKKLVDLIKDIEKSHNYVQNKKLLKEITEKQKGYLLDGVSSKAMKTFKENGPYLNDVEKNFKIKDFEVIINNKKREEYIGLDYKTKTLKKAIKYDNKL